jgi:hypothetical protein
VSVQGDLLADEGAQRALDGAHEGWVRAAKHTLWQLCREGQGFTTDAIWYRLEVAGVSTFPVPVLYWRVERCRWSIQRLNVDGQVLFVACPMGWLSVGVKRRVESPWSPFEVEPRWVRWLERVRSARPGRVVPALQPPSEYRGDDGSFDHCGCCAHRRSESGCGGPDCPCRPPEKPRSTGDSA